ncbi:MAG: helix-turn-helix transcriptional regulator [Prevotella sp.]|nr:helix-turn-helix transcriptional regulator [Candidatus Prevotella equi]
MRDKDILPVTIEHLVDNYDMLHIDNEIALVKSLRSIPEMNEPRRMSLCLFVGMCTSGVCSVSVNGKKRMVERNQVMLITDESVIDSINYSSDFDGIGFYVSYRLLQEILKDITNMSDVFLLTHNHPVFSINDVERNMMERYFNEVKFRVEMNAHRYRLQVVRLILLTMIYDLSNAFDRVLMNSTKEDKQSRSERIFVRFIQHVEHHFKEQRQVQWYANLMGLSPKYLCEIITNVSRRSPNEWIDKFVTTEIRNQLRHTNKRISQIAEEMNFPTQSFFGKYFKENVGVSPSDYRNGIER